VRRLWYSLTYLLGRSPWDTNITPPEIVALIETDGLPAGRALDLGCGTGTNSIYLAQRGWQVTGIDFVGSAIRQARRKARQAGVAGQVNFLTDSVARLGQLDLPTIDLAMDIGCLHGLSPQQQAAYAEGLSAVARPGATYMLYAFQPREIGGDQLGLTADDVRQLFAPGFRVVHVDYGEDPVGESTSAWYRLERQT